LGNRNDVTPIGWTQVKATDDLNLIELWIENHPGDENEEAARLYLEMLKRENAIETNTSEAYDDYLTEYPDGPHSESIRFLRDNLYSPGLDADEDAATIELWLKQNPRKRHAAEARLRLMIEKTDPNEDTAVRLAGLCDLYVKEFPERRYAGTVRELGDSLKQVFREELLIVQIRENHSLKSCDFYLTRYPQGEHVQEVLDIRSEAEWRQLEASRDVRAIREWLEANPENVNSKAARVLLDDAAYQDILSTGSSPSSLKARLDACRLYLDKFPDGRHLADVRELRASTEWLIIRDERDAEAVKRWLAENHQSDLRMEAHVLWEDLRLEEVVRTTSARACSVYLREFPEGRHAQLVEAWQQTIHENTVEGYRAFREHFPDSELAAPAEERTRYEHWCAVVADAPNDDHALVELASSCLLQAACDMVQLESYYRRALKLNTRNARAYLGLAILLYDGRDHKESRSMLAECLAVDDSIPEAHFYLGKISQREGSCSAAISSFDKAIDLNPGYTAAFFHRAQCKEETLGCECALGDYERVLELSSRKDSIFALQARHRIEDCR